MAEAAGVRDTRDRGLEVWVHVDLSDANENEVTLTVGEVTVVVWLLDLAARQGELPPEAEGIWSRTRARLAERVEAVTAGS